jgi:hypothetical protein
LTIRCCHSPLSATGGTWSRSSGSPSGSSPRSTSRAVSIKSRIFPMLAVERTKLAQCSPSTWPVVADRKDILQETSGHVAATSSSRDDRVAGSTRRLCQ